MNKRNQEPKQVKPESTSMTMFVSPSSKLLYTLEHLYNYASVITLHFRYIYLRTRVKIGQIRNEKPNKDVEEQELKYE